MAPSADAARRRRRDSLPRRDSLLRRDSLPRRDALLRRPPDLYLLWNAAVAVALVGMFIYLVFFFE